MIYDCSMFFNENDIFEIRLNQHWDFVDKFIIVEAGQTHTGIAKPFNFDLERFKPYMDKIVYRTFDSFDEERKKFPDYYDFLDDSIHDFKPEWFRDDFQGNYCFKVLGDVGAKGDDIVYFSPPDEILKKSAMEDAIERFKNPEVYTITDASNRITAKNTRPIFHAMMDLYVYKFNLIAGVNPKRPYGSFSEFGNHKIIYPSLARNCGLVTHEAIKDAGWHLSYMDPGDGENVLQKMHSWAHARDPGRGVNGATRMDSTTIVDAMTILHNEFSPTMIEMSYDTHPAYIIDNIDKYQNYIFKP